MSGSGSNSVVYVGRLSSRTRERDLEDAFSKYGRIIRLDMKAGYAFIEYNGTVFLRGLLPLPHRIASQDSVPNFVSIHLGFD
jgi:hypothetical protein